MMIDADVQSGQCKICLQGVGDPIPVLEMARTAGYQAWQLAVCKKCAAEIRQHLENFLSPRDD